MKETPISPETAKLAKEKGFDWEVTDCYEIDNCLSKNWILQNNSLCMGNSSDLIHAMTGDSNCAFLPTIDYNKSPFYSDYYYSAPTQSLLQKWLREVHNIHLEITRDDPNDILTWYVNIYDLKEHHRTYGFRESFYYAEVNGKAVRHKTFEEALETGLQEALKLIKL